MSGANSFQRDSQEPIGLSLNLSSNNPFRNRAASPASPFDDPPARPLSRNPFLEQPPPPLKSPGAMSNNSEGAKSLSAEEIFNSLTLDEKKPMELKGPGSNDADRPGRENVPPPDATNRHPSTASQEEALRARKMPPPGARAGPSASPNRKPPPRPRARRNSDSSVLDFDSMPLTEEEKMIISRRRERERQKREPRPEAQPKESRERREPREPREPREAKEGREPREGKSSRSKSGRPNRRVDIIDQLDATGIYGTGLFHHDGPFDALNPHRNRNRARRAPMQAFPKDSLNNSLGGAGPLKADHSTFMGQGNDEAFREFSFRTADTPDDDTRGAGSKPRIIDPIARGDIIHGEQSVGLGTSTFLEGTPAARTAIVRTREEQLRDGVEGGLQRKKSLAQRIRHINKGPRDYGSGRVTSPEGSASNGIASAGPTEGNPFFTEYGKGEEGFTVRPRDGVASPNSPPRRRGSSGAALERRATADGSMGAEDVGKPSGFLGRMKSLKGGRRQRRDDSGPASPPGNPGTAI